MRILTSLLAIFFLTTHLFSQEENETLKVELGNYIFISAFQTDSITDFNGKVTHKDLRVRIHNPGIKIKIINILKDSVVIQYLKKNSTKEDFNSENNNFNTTFYGDENGLYYYKLKKEDFLKVCTRYYRRFKGASAGFYSVPFKLRFKNFDFEQDLNLGISIGLQYRLSKKLDNKWILEPSFGIGLTKVKLEFA